MKAVFIFPPNVHLLDITGPAHIFYEAACEHVPVEMIFCSMFDRQYDVVSSCSLQIAGLVPFNAITLETGDLIFIPGLDALHLFDINFIQSTWQFQSWLKKHHHKGVIICSVCTGAFLLAEAGLLDRKECTTHWKYANRFKKRFPSAKFLTNRLFVQDKTIFTSAGVASGIDLALYIIEYNWGSRFATRIAKEVVIYFRRTSQDPQLNIFTQYRNHLDERIHVIQDKLIHQIGSKLNIFLLAEEMNMSARNLTRIFKKTTGITIGNYLNQLRSAKGRQLISEGHTQHSTALQCGLKSTNQIRSLLKKNY